MLKTGYVYIYRTQENLDNRFDLIDCFSNILGSVSSTSSHQFSSTSLLYQRVQALSTVNQKVGTNMGTKKSIDTHHSRAASLDVDEPNQRGYYRTNSSLVRYKESDIHSRRSSLTEEGSSSGCYSDPTSSSSQVYFHFHNQSIIPIDDKWSDRSYNFSSVAFLTFR